MLLVIVFAVVVQFSTAIVDPVCVDENGDIPPSARACDNVLPDSVCESMYNYQTDVPDRYDNCFGIKNADGVVVFNEDLKQMAIASCPARCDYCCERPLDPKFDCPDADAPRISCASVTSLMCNDPNWRPILAEDCPAACGLCLERECVDVIPECQVSYCSTIGLESFVATNCKLTCGLCASSSTTNTGTAVNVPAAVATCTLPPDNANCANWVSKQFCSNPFYTQAQKRQYCPRACNLC